MAIAAQADHNSTGAGNVTHRRTFREYSPIFVRHINNDFQRTYICTSLVNNNSEQGVVFSHCHGLLRHAVIVSESDVAVGGSQLQMLVLLLLQVLLVVGVADLIRLIHLKVRPLKGFWQITHTHSTEK